MSSSAIRHFLRFAAKDEVNADIGPAGGERHHDRVLRG